MFTTVIGALLLISAAASAKITPKLSNGEDALIAELPFVVSIQEINVHVCGGTLLSERWILSSARCFATRNIADLNIEYGNTVITPGPTGDNKAAIAQVIIHEDFGVGPTVNDIAVAMSATPMITGLFEPFVKLAAPGARVPSGISSVHAGWGHTSLGVRATTLQKASVGIISHEECKIAAGETQWPSRSNICAYGESLICTGDLGTCFNICVCLFLTFFVV